MLLLELIGCIGHLIKKVLGKLRDLVLNRRISFQLITSNRGNSLNLFT